MLMMKAAAILLLMVCIKGVYSATCNHPVAEGSVATFFEYLPETSLTDGKLQLRLTDVAGIDKTVAECNINDSYACQDRVIYLHVRMDRAGSGYFLDVTKFNVNRVNDQTTWKWVDAAEDGSVIGQCDLNVYSFNSAPVCQPLRISSDGKTVVWTCTVQKVYPELECRFKNRKGKRGPMIPQNSDTQKTTIDGKYPPRTVYHDYTCTLNLPVSQLDGEGTYQFNFTAAVVKGSSTYKNASPIVKDLNLAYPRVELVGCPNANDSTQGYISERDNTKTCQCHLKEVGNPPGVAQWLDAQGSLVGQDGSLSLVYNPDDPAPAYTCRGYSPLGPGPTITYKPTFAYGPSVITIVFDPQPETRNRCEHNASFTTFCDIATTNANPEPTVSVTASDGSTVTELSRNNTVDYYRHKFKVTPEKGGIFAVTCLSFNPIFPDLKTKKK